MRKLKAFEPIITSASEILILGSMPSELSLQKQQYYANPRNQFWKIMGNLFGIQFGTDYQQRLNLLKGHKIGLWDVIHSCHRPGSLDSHISDVKVNDFAPFLKKYPSIKLIGCNGKTAYHLFVKHFTVKIPVAALPSSSPAYTKSLDWKVKQWGRLLGR